jgi:MFS family permease
MPEPQTNPISLKAALRVSVYIPRDQFMLFVITAMCYLATWMVSCFFQSFSSTIAYDCFNDRTPLAGSVLLALTMAPSMLGGPLTARIPAKPTLVGGMVLVTFTTALMALCIINEWQIVFWVACFFNSLAMGACLGTSVRVLLLETNVRFVSAILSSINLIAYAGVAVIGLITGALLTATNYATTFAVMALVLVLCTFFVAHELKKAPNGEHSRILTAARIIKRYSRQLKPHAK